MSGRFSQSQIGNMSWGMAMPETIKHRVGLLIPSSNTNVEPEYYSVMPASVSVHFARLTMTAVNDEGLTRQDDDVTRQAELLATAGVEIILFCQVAASFYHGLEYDTKLRMRIENASGKPAITAAQTTIDALNVLGARSISIASPFTPEVYNISSAFLTANGFDVLAVEGLGYVDNYSIALIEYDTVRDMVRRSDHPDAEVIVILGGNMPCLLIADELERELGKPVITTNQTGIWALLRHLGGFQGLTGMGQLLRKHLAS